MDYKQIKKLMDDMGESKLTALDIEFPDGIKISMKKENNGEVVKYIETEKSQIVENLPKKINVLPDSNECKNITSPMVGTFYSKASPTTKPFVEVGSKVKKGDVVCIIEAMKLMNEIEADIDGEVIEICANDGEVVDYGKVLFKLKP